MRINDTITWTPAAFEGANGIMSVGRYGEVHGRIVYINRKHRYFTAEADINGYKLRESFKF